MTVYAPYMLAGAAIATGLLMLLRELLPTQPDVKDAVARLAPHNLQLLTRAQGDSPVALSRLASLAARIDRVMDRIPGFAVSPQDRAILRARRPNSPANDPWALKFACGLTGLLLPTGLGLVLQATGSGIPFIVPAGLGVVLGALAWALPNVQLQSEAAVARAEFLRVAIAFLRLVAIQRLAGAFPNTALVGASEISEHWAFRRLRQELIRAEWARVPTWDAITSLAEQVGVPQLADVGDIMRLAGEGSDAVADSLLARAKSLREQILADAHAAANRSTTTMAVPRTSLLLILMFAVFIPISSVLLG
ncbi:hypothetical protein [Ornithinimicrobium murale]|uniref:hypothetical protein n=1 Tax=Ornithinimicrobium murale TaxID=1050153 RepID=UPI0013B42F14|nr:hypothetical protein [Ornithinimicrobium murale]